MFFSITFTPIQIETQTENFICSALQTSSSEDLLTVIGTKMVSARRWYWRKEGCPSSKRTRILLDLWSSRQSFENTKRKRQNGVVYLKKKKKEQHAIVLSFYLKKKKKKTNRCFKKLKKHKRRHFTFKPSKIEQNDPDSVSFTSELCTYLFFFF